MPRLVSWTLRGAIAVVSRGSTSGRSLWNDEMRRISHRMVNVGGVLILKTEVALCCFRFIDASASLSSTAVTLR